MARKPQPPPSINVSPKNRFAASVRVVERHINSIFAVVVVLAPQ